MAEPAPAPPSIAFAVLNGNAPLLAAATPTTAPAPTPPAVTQSVCISPLLFKILQALSCHSTSSLPLMRPHVANAPAAVPKTKARPDDRKVRVSNVVVSIGVFWYRALAASNGNRRSDTNVNDIADALIT